MSELRQVIQRSNSIHSRDSKKWKNDERSLWAASEIAANGTIFLDAHFQRCAGLIDHAGRPGASPCFAIRSCLTC
jgi:hypothetical protein